MQIDQETRDGRLVLTPHGSLLCAGPAEQFEALLQNVLAEGHRHLIVVLEQVPHIDSGALGKLVSCLIHAREAQSSLKLVGLTGRVVELLTITKLITNFDTYDTEQQAIASCLTTA